MTRKGGATIDGNDQRPRKNHIGSQHTDARNNGKHLNVFLAVIVCLSSLLLSKGSTLIVNSDKLCWSSPEQTRTAQNDPEQPKTCQNRPKQPRTPRSSPEQPKQPRTAQTAQNNPRQPRTTQSSPEQPKQLRTTQNNPNNPEQPRTT